MPSNNEFYVRLILGLALCEASYTFFSTIMVPAVEFYNTVISSAQSSPTSYFTAYELSIDVVNHLLAVLLALNNPERCI
jgi:hypothetical protein